jgi:prepilin-type N-terminal cleavage/methylation domain-containing protein
MTNIRKRNRLNLESNFRRRSFTLVEMLIVITILVIFTGVIGINVAKALREQKFNTEVGLVVERLRFCQNIMLVLNRDVNFIVQKALREEGLEIKIEVEGGVAKEWRFIIDRSHIILKTIHSFQFDDALSFPVNPNQVRIRFLSGGTVMSRGIIHLSTHENPKEEGAMNSAIILYGYPHPIESVSEIDKPAVLKDEDRNEDLRMTEYTVEELKNYEEIQKSKQPAKPQGTVPNPAPQEDKKIPLAP